MKIIQYDNTIYNKVQILRTSRMSFRILINDSIYKYNTYNRDLEYLGTLPDDYDIKEIKEIKDE